MTDIILRVPDYLKKRFEARVGKGNMSLAIRNYIEAVIGGAETIDEQILKKEVELLEKEKQDLDSRYIEKKSQLDALTQFKEAAYLEALKKEKELQEKFADIKMNTAVKHLGSMIK